MNYYRGWDEENRGGDVGSELWGQLLQLIAEIYNYKIILIIQQDLVADQNNDGLIKVPGHTSIYRPKPVPGRMKDTGNGVIYIAMINGNHYNYFKVPHIEDCNPIDID